MVSASERRPPKNVRALRAGTAAFEAGTRELLHLHPEDGQLKWPGAVASVQTPRGIFVVPPGAAVWIPPNQRHGGLYPCAMQERSLYVYLERCAALPAACCAVRVTPRMAEMIAGFVRQHREEHGGWRELEQSALSILADELRDSGVAPLELSIPEAPAIMAVTSAVLANPTLVRSLAEWSEFLGLSQSSVDRAFRRYTGLPLGAWCRRARLLYALRRLASGAEVATIAGELGYGASAFVQTFRKALGTTPGRYFAALADSPRPAAAHEAPALAIYGGSG